MIFDKLRLDTCSSIQQRLILGREQQLYFYHLRDRTNSSDILQEVQHNMK